METVKYWLISVCIPVSADVRVSRGARRV